MSYAFVWEASMLEHAPPEWRATRGVLQALRTFMKNETGQAFPSIGTLAKRSGRSAKTVIKALNEAEKGDWLHIERRQGRSSHYQAIIPPDVQATLTASELRRIPEELRGEPAPPEVRPEDTAPVEPGATNSTSNSGENSKRGESAPPPSEGEERSLLPALEPLQKFRELHALLSPDEMQALLDTSGLRLRHGYTLSPLDLRDLGSEALKPLFDKYRDEAETDTVPTAPTSPTEPSDAAD